MHSGTIRGEQTRTGSRAPRATSTGYALGTGPGYALGTGPGYAHDDTGPGYALDTASSFGLGASVTFALDPLRSLIFRSPGSP
jgi:hypothetical protein